MNSNHTMVTGFILLGFSGVIRNQVVLFPIFLCTYIITVCGNLCIILAYKLSPRLHTPMYFFLSNLSLLEIIYVSCTVPKMLSSLWPEGKLIFSGCAIQMYCVLLLGTAEMCMLGAMAYDRYIAICYPLMYTVIMSEVVCIQLIVASYVIGAVNSLIHTKLTLSLPFCRSKEIDHFFCDVPPILVLACQDTWVNELVIFLSVFFVMIGSFIVTLISYVKIISKILKLHSTSSKKKTFATCSSHVIVVTIFFGSAIFTYFRPKSTYRIGQNSLVSLMYTTISPLLNPFIYSLRNKEVTSSIKNIFLLKIKF